MRVVNGSVTRWLMILFGCLAVVAHSQTSAAEDRGRITAVRLTPDLKQVMLRFQGPIGKHSAFVMGGPYRLVVDFDATELAKIPAKISVGKNPINEIRLGYNDSRARLVVDFGNNPVPPFKIHRQGDVVTVDLGKSLAPAAGMPSRPPARVSAQTSQGTSVRSKPAPRTETRSPRARPAEPDSKMVVKKAGVTDDLVFVELANRKNPSKAYRLVIDLDHEKLQVRHATLSDGAGNVKRFDLAAGTDEAPGVSIETVGPVSGPRKAPEGLEDGQASKPKFKWGLQSARTSETPKAGVKDKGGLRIQEFTLQQKKPSTDG